MMSNCQPRTSYSEHWPQKGTDIQVRVFPAEATVKQPAPVLTQDAPYREDKYSIYVVSVKNINM